MRSGWGPHPARCACLSATKFHRKQQFTRMPWGGPENYRTRTQPGPDSGSGRILCVCTVGLSGKRWGKRTSRTEARITKKEISTGTSPSAGLPLKDHQQQATADPGRAPPLRPQAPASDSLRSPSVASCPLPAFLALRGVLRAWLRLRLRLRGRRARFIFCPSHSRCAVSAGRPFCFLVTRVPARVTLVLSFKSNSFASTTWPTAWCKGPSSGPVGCLAGLPPRPKFNNDVSQGTGSPQG